MRVKVICGGGLYPKVESEFVGDDVGMTFFVLDAVVVITLPNQDRFTDFRSGMTCTSEAVLSEDSEETSGDCALAVDSGSGRPRGGVGGVIFRRGAEAGSGEEAVVIGVGSGSVFRITASEDAVVADDASCPALDFSTCGWGRAVGFSVWASMTEGVVS